MKNIGIFLSEHFQFLVVKLSIYLHRRVFVMKLELSALENLKKNTFMGYDVIKP